MHICFEQTYPMQASSNAMGDRILGIPVKICIEDKVFLFDMVDQPEVGWVLTGNLGEDDIASDAFFKRELERIGIEDGKLHLCASRRLAEFGDEAIDHALKVLKGEADWHEFKNRKSVLHIDDPLLEEPGLSR